MAYRFEYPPGPQPPPAQRAHRFTYFIVIGPSARLLTCASYEVEIGFELRLAYSEAHVLRSELFLGEDADRRAETEARAWRLMLLAAGFGDVLGPEPHGDPDLRKG